MSNLTQNLLSTYYGFGKKTEIGKTLSTHECVKIMDDEINISLVDESFENEEPLTIDDSKEDTNEQCEEGSSTLDEKSSICDEEIIDDDDFSMEYVDIVEKLCEARSSTTDTISLENNFKKLKLDDNNDENLENDKISSNEINENENCSEAMNSSRKISMIQESCDGIFLNLSCCELFSLPKNIFIQFPNLKLLYLEGNKLDEIPEELFTNLKSLQWLDVRNNQIKFLPLTIKGHLNLETILIQRNKLEKLPIELGTLLNLKNLQASHNPLLYPPKEILNLGSNEVLNFLREEWNKIYPNETIEIKKDVIMPNPWTLLSHQSKEKIKKSLKMPIKKYQAKKEEKSTRMRRLNYKPSNRCENYQPNDYLEIRLLRMEKAKELLDRRALELQRLMNKSTLKKWRYDRSSNEKSMKKAANRREEDIPFAVDSNLIPVSIKPIEKKKTSMTRNRFFDEPITDINKNIDQIFESLNKLKLSEISESSNTALDKELLEAEMQKIQELQNSIKHLKMYNDIITDKFFTEENNRKPYKAPPSIII